MRLESPSRSWRASRSFPTALFRPLSKSPNATSDQSCPCNTSRVTTSPARSSRIRRTRSGCAGRRTVRPFRISSPEVRSSSISTNRALSVSVLLAISSPCVLHRAPKRFDTDKDGSQTAEKTRGEMMDFLGTRCALQVFQLSRSLLHVRSLHAREIEREGDEHERLSSGWCALLLSAVVALPVAAVVGVIPISNVDALYGAVNDPANAGATLVLAPGTYVLSATDTSNAARPNGGRIELQPNMSIVGVEGERRGGDRCVRPSGEFVPADQRPQRRGPKGAGSQHSRMAQRSGCGERTGKYRRGAACA